MGRQLTQPPSLTGPWGAGRGEDLPPLDEWKSCHLPFQLLEQASRIVRQCPLDFADEEGVPPLALRYEVDFPDALAVRDGLVAVGGTTVRVFFPSTTR